VTDVRCPVCGGMGGAIDRFNHALWHDCVLCEGEGRIKPIIFDYQEAMQFMDNVVADLDQRRKDAAQAEADYWRDEDDTP